MHTCTYVLTSTYVHTHACTYVRTHGIMKLVFLSIENTPSRSLCHLLMYCILTPVNKDPMGVSYIRIRTYVRKYVHEP